MATRENMGEPIEPGFIARVAQGLRYAISGVTPLTWMGPSQPLAPLEQEQTEGRAFDYRVGYNLQIQPRSEEAISFAQLRGLADGYDLLRLVIETRKDQIEAFQWEITAYDTDESADKYKDEIKAVTEFLQSPDKEHDWQQWLRLQLEELLVIDAICVYPRVSRGGDLYGLELVDGATIKRLLDDGGRTPIPPDPAYQQVLKGVPTSDYTREQLIYRMRNPRVSRVYGYSPVEQVITTVNIALRRQLSQLDAYTQGNVPEALAQVPATWTSAQIADFQTWWDSVMTGNIAAKRQIKFIPSLENIVFPKEGILKDEYDEWLARIVCFAFSVSPSALIKQVNRASGEQMADTAKEEGLVPLLNFLASHMTSLIRMTMGMPGLRFKFKMANKVAPLDQANMDNIYIQAKVKTPDEVREDLGMDRLTPQQREEAFPSGPDPLDVIEAQARAKAGVDGGAKPGEEDKPPPGEKAPPKEAAPPTKDDKPTAAEKMLSEALAMLDPQRIADIMAKVVRAQPPTVVEVKPEVNVEVGDTQVNVPPAKTAPAPVDPRLGKSFVVERRADGSMVAKYEQDDDVITKTEASE